MIVKCILLPVVGVFLFELFSEECFVAPLMVSCIVGSLAVQVLNEVTEIVHCVKHRIRGSLGHYFVTSLLVDDKHSLHFVGDLHQAHGLRLGIATTA